MKKKIFAAVLAVMAAVFMAACESGVGSGSAADDIIDETTAEEITKLTTKAEENKETETEPETESETEPETESETEAETESETETEPETDNTVEKTAAAGEIYQGRGYTLTIDTEKWGDASEYIKLISEYSSELDINVNASAEDIENMSDGIFFHTGLLGTNFNIVCNEIGDLGPDFDISMFAGLMKKEYTASGMTYLSDDIVKHNGKNWLKIEVEVEQSGTTMRMLQYMTVNGVNQYVITYTSCKADYDKALSDFEEVFASFEFTEYI